MDFGDDGHDGVLCLVWVMLRVLDRMRDERGRKERRRYFWGEIRVTQL